MVSNTFQHLHPFPATHCLNTVRLLWEGGEGGRGGGQREDRGAAVHKRGRKYQQDWLNLQSIKPVKMTFSFGVFMVN